MLLTSGGAALILTLHMPQLWEACQAKSELARIFLAIFSGFALGLSD